MHIRSIAYSVTIGLFASVPTALCYSAATEETLSQLPCLSLFPNPRMASLVLAALAFIVVSSCMYLVLAKMPGWVNRYEEKPHRFLGLGLNLKDACSAAVLIMVCWIPAVILLFPGTYDWFDTLNQIYQFTTPAPTYYTATHQIIDAEIIDHHPWFDTVLFGSFIEFGRLFGSDDFGVFSYCLFQMIFTALVLAVTVCYLEKLGVPWVLRACGLVFFVTMPAIPAYAYSMQKDSLFAPIYLMFALVYIESFRSKGRALSRPWFVVLFITVATLSALTKKTGIYLVLLCGIILVVFLRGVRLKASIAAFAPVLLCGLAVPALVFPVIGISPGGSQEVFGFMYQQSIALLKERPDSYSEKELSILNSVLKSEKALESYTPDKTDAVKSKQRLDVSRSSFLRYLKLWVKKGLQNPDVYLRSLGSCVSGMLIPSQSLAFETGLNRDKVELFERHAQKAGSEFTFTAESPALTQSVVQPLYSFYFDVMCAAPVASLFFTMGFYTTWIPLFAFGVALYFKRRDVVFSLAPIILGSLILLVSPTVLSRYVLYLVLLSIPTLGCAIWAMHGSERRCEV